MKANSRRILIGFTLSCLLGTVFQISGFTAGTKEPVTNTPVVIYAQVGVDAIAGFKFPTNTIITDAQMVTGDSVMVNAGEVDRKRLGQGSMEWLKRNSTYMKKNKKISLNG